MCRGDAFIPSQQAFLSMAGGEESSCSFNLEGGKKQVTLVVALKLLILVDVFNLKL